MCRYFVLRSVKHEHFVIKLGSTKKKSLAQYYTLFTTSMTINVLNLLLCQLDLTLFLAGTPPPAYQQHEDNQHNQHSQQTVQLSLYHNGQLTINDWNYLLNSIKIHHRNKMSL
jgi:hypothetical protein